MKLKYKQTPGIFSRKNEKQIYNRDLKISQQIFIYVIHKVVTENISLYYYYKLRD